MKFQHKVALVFLAMTFVLLGGTAVFVFQNAAGNIKHELGRRMSAIAAVASMTLDGDEHEKVAKLRDMNHPLYKKLKKHLVTTLWYVPGFKATHIYTLRKTSKPNIFEYIVDGDSHESAIRLGKLYDVTDFPELRAAYNGPTHDKEIRRDPSGEFLSGYAPILTKDSETVGIIGVDATTDSLREKNAYVFQRLAYIVAAGLLLSLPCAWLAAALLAAPIQKLIVAAEEVGRGNFDHRVEIASSDELGKLATAFNRMSAGLKERDFVKDAFQKYVSKEVAEKIMTMPLESVMAGERRRVTVLFTDVRRFTELSERLKPEEVLKTLNDHFSMLIDVLFEFEGTLDKFMGDGLMAIFGAPVAHGNDAERALRAALKMQDKVREYNDKRKSEGQPLIEIGIGVNTGTAVAGNIGSIRRKEYSVVGDTVNIAARLQGIAPGGQIYVTGTTYDELKDILKAEKLPPQSLKGKSGPVEVYRALAFTA